MKVACWLPITLHALVAGLVLALPAAGGYYLEPMPMSRCVHKPCAQVAAAATFLPQLLLASFVLATWGTLMDRHAVSSLAHTAGTAAVVGFVASVGPAHASATVYIYAVVSCALVAGAEYNAQKKK